MPDHALVKFHIHRLQCLVFRKFQCRNSICYSQAH